MPSAFNLRNSSSCLRVKAEVSCGQQHFRLAPKSGRKSSIPERQLGANNGISHRDKFLFDQFVGRHQEAVGDAETKRFSGLKINHHFELD